MSKLDGYFDSKNHDRQYNAEEISRLFDGLIIDGVFKNYLGGLEVQLKEIVEEAPTNMNVVVKSGRCWFNHTWLYNDSDFVIEIAENTGDANRIDAIVIDVDLTDDYRETSIQLINQTVLNKYPTLIRDESFHIQYPLAYIIVPPNIKKLTNENIIDRRGKIAVDHGTQGIEYGTPFALTLLGTAALRTNIEGMNMIGFQFEKSEDLVAEKMEPNLFYGVAELREE